MKNKLSWKLFVTTQLSSFAVRLVPVKLLRCPSSYTRPVGHIPTVVSMEIYSNIIRILAANSYIDTPGMIGVTQPRRVAAVSMANRVSHELGLSSQEVSYQVDFGARIK